MYFVCMFLQQIIGTVQFGSAHIKFTIVSPAQIIVDKTKCSTTTPTLVPAPPPEMVSDTTCRVITDLTASSQESQPSIVCSARPLCDGMTCELVGGYYTTDIQVLACSDPARFYVRVTRIDTHLFSGIITQTTNVDLESSYGQLQIPIVDYGDEISIEVWKQMVWQCCVCCFCVIYTQCINALIDHHE